MSSEELVDYQVNVFYAAFIAYGGAKGISGIKNIPSNIKTTVASIKTIPSKIKSTISRITEGAGKAKTPVESKSFGNSKTPRGARPKQDFGVNDFNDLVGPESGPLPKGASNTTDIDNAPLSGHYHVLPEGTELPDGLGIIADGSDVVPNSPHGPGHYTIYPTKAMTVADFNELYKSLPWIYGGKK